MTVIKSTLAKVFFARPVENTFDLAQHLYIVSSDSQGHKKILRAGPGDK